MDELLLNHHLQESLDFPDPFFPIKYYVDNLQQWPDFQVPLHWHFGYEFFTSLSQDIEVQVGNEQITLLKGESILISGGQLHRYNAAMPDEPCLCPNIIFSSEVLAPMTSTLFQTYLRHLLNDPSLPYILVSAGEGWQEEVSRHLLKVYGLLAAAKKDQAGEPDYGAVKKQFSVCPEMEVHENLFHVIKLLFLHREEFRRQRVSSADQQIQIRLQKLLRFIQENYHKPISLGEVAASAGISRSEAERCFKRYHACSPMNYVIQYRLRRAQELLLNSALSVKEISFQCGFRDSSYFVKVFRKHLGQTPAEYRKVKGAGRP